MKLLLENWRQYLNEGAKTVDDLPDGVEIVVYKTRGGNYVTIEYAEVGGGNRGFSSENSPIRGDIHITKMSEPLCGEAWKVAGSRAEEGWGPLLYDLAIEWASKFGGGLIPDRISVSKDARKVWKYYLNNRPYVIAHQLDDEDNTLTPDDWDNCDQSVAKKSTVPIIGGFLSRDFTSKSNPMSKRYTKEPDTLRKLMDAGRLVEK